MSLAIRSNFHAVIDHPGSPDITDVFEIGVWITEPKRNVLQINVVKLGYVVQAFFVSTLSIHIHCRQNTDCDCAAAGDTTHHNEAAAKTTAKRLGIVVTSHLLPAL
jgi:hypothetical protein